LLLCNQVFDSHLLGQPVAQEIPDKFQVLWPARRQFAEGQVMHFQTPTNGTAGVLTADAHQSVLPSRRQMGGFWTNPSSSVEDGEMWICWGF
jgi:hypothetical protein